MLDATVTHDHTDTIILEAPVTKEALGDLLKIAKSGGSFAACDDSYCPREGFPRLAMVMQTYASNDFFTGENSERNFQLMQSRRKAYEKNPLDHETLESKTRSKGIFGRLVLRVFGALATASRESPTAAAARADRERLVRAHHATTPRPRCV